MIGIESTVNPVPLPHKNPAYEGRWIFSVDNRGNVVREINFSTSVMYGSTDEGYLVAGFFDYEHHDFTDTPTISSAKKLWIQSGANNNQGMYIDLYDCRKETLEITNLNVLTRTQANQSIYDIDKAFGKVNVYRATAGAQQNRLEHTMRSLDISFENLSESESRIRNADMAKEIITHIGMILLTQAAVAMLAQANQQAELAVSLLR
jgi:flagellin